jgi:serine/threonine-protein kinase
LDRENVLRLAQEALSLTRLEHPGIVRFYGLGREGPFFYLVLEYVPGVDLRQRVDTGPPVAFDRAARWGVEVGEALVFAHARDVIHRDLKPSNVLVDLGDRARLGDFGMARVLGSSGVRLTRTGSSLGTLKFCAPELLDDAKEAGPAADQFGLAATLFYTLTRDFPFAGESLLEVIRAMREGLVSPMSKNREDVPGALEAAIRVALSTDPGARYPSMEVFVRELAPFAEPDRGGDPPEES